MEQTHSWVRVHGLRLDHSGWTGVLHSCICPQCLEIYFLLHCLKINNIGIFAVLLAPFQGQLIREPVLVVGGQT